MARISIEDCLKQVENRFALVHLAAERARQLGKGSRPLIHTKNKYIVTSLREIAGEKIAFQKQPDYKEIKISKAYPAA
jgi:DNA-directed RNA polymerase subunit omega